MEAAADGGDALGAVEVHDLVVVGAGAGGLALAVLAGRAGIDDVVVLERADGVGGTWRVNTYPGAECDVPSHLYSYSFALNPAWSKTIKLKFNKL